MSNRDAEAAISRARRTEPLRKRSAKPVLSLAVQYAVSAGEPPSRRIARLQRLIDLLDAHRNQVFAMVSLGLLWRTNFALAIESWRAVSGPAVPRWLAAIGERIIEANAPAEGAADTRAELARAQPRPWVGEALAA